MYVLNTRRHRLPGDDVCRRRYAVHQAPQTFPPQEEGTHGREGLPRFSAADSDITQRFAPDAWGVDDSPVRALFEPLEKWLEENVPSIVDRYPQQYGTKLWLQRVVRETLLSEEMVKEYAGYFRGTGYDDLDELAKSFSLGESSRVKLGRRDARRSQVRGGHVWRT
jgi:hypothetical protein